LYEATSESRWLKEAATLHDVLETHYSDVSRGGYYRTAHDAEKLLTRNKPSYDGAQPSGNSIAARNLLRLWEYTGDQKWRTAAERVLKWCASWIVRGGTAVPAMLCALDQYHQVTRQVFIIRAPGDATAAPLMAVLRKQFLPNRIVAVVSEGAETNALAKTIPYVAQKTAQGGRSTAYVCERGICKKPTSNPEEFAKQLAAK
jgi:uncharacterized protein YyaL (SSP411 family)